MEPVRLETTKWVNVKILRRKEKESVAAIAEEIMDVGIFLRDAGGSLYVYDKGKYVANAETTIKLAYGDYLKLQRRKDHWTKRNSDDIVVYIREHVGYMWDGDNQPLSTINLLNGILRVSGSDDPNELAIIEPHTPEWKSTLQIPISYDRDATCPQWDKFLNEVCPVGNEILLEIIGLCMVPNMGLQTGIVLVGSGSNGKSTYLEGLEAAIGKVNVGDVSLHALANTKDKFATAGLVGKLVNKFGDLSMQTLGDPSVIKAIIGQDRITVERKFQHPFEYTPFCKLIFSSNHGKLRSKDQSYGFLRKFQYIPFNETFSVNPTKHEELKKALKDPKELSGLLNRILPRMKSLLTKGFTKGLLENLEELETDEIVRPYTLIPSAEEQDWLMTNVEIAEGEDILFQTLYDEFSKYFPVTRNDLSDYMKHTFPDIVKARRRKGTNPARYYLNVRLKST